MVRTFHAGNRPAARASVAPMAGKRPVAPERYPLLQWKCQNPPGNLERCVRMGPAPLFRTLHSDGARRGHGQLDRPCRRSRSRQGARTPRPDLRPRLAFRRSCRRPARQLCGRRRHRDLRLAEIARRSRRPGVRGRLADPGAGSPGQPASGRRRPVGAFSGWRSQWARQLAADETRPPRRRRHRRSGRPPRRRAAKKREGG